MKFEIFKFENVTSTNDIAINLIKKEQKETGCVYAETQTKDYCDVDRAQFSN